MQISPTFFSKTIKKKFGNYDFSITYLTHRRLHTALIFSRKSMDEKQSPL